MLLLKQLTRLRQS
jgi:hypothetical protein